MGSATAGSNGDPHMRKGPHSITDTDPELLSSPASFQRSLKQLLIAQRLEGRGVDDPLPPACQNAPIESLFFCLRTCQHDAVGLAPSKASVMTQVLAQGDMSAHQRAGL